jgi:hypothetical protein
MRRPACLALCASLLLSGGCGGTLYLAIKGTSPLSPAEVFDCVQKQIPILGYTQVSIDVEDHRLTARKYDREGRIADTRFQRMIDRLLVEVRSAAPPGNTRLQIGAHTFALLTTQRGPTEIEQEASPAVRAAAQTLLETCGS